MDFKYQVYKVIKKIPRGRVSTYKQVAEKLGISAYRAVGQALKKNENSPVIPCHRVVRSNGGIGGFFGKIDSDSLRKKIKLLESEGIRVRENKIVDFEKVRINL